jgi:hypothetical protein
MYLQFGHEMFSPLNVVYKTQFETLLVAYKV